MSETKKTVPVRVNTQYFTSIVVNLIMIGCGSGMGWLPMSLPFFHLEASELDAEKHSLSDMSGIGSIVSLGALAGNCLFGFIVTVIGTRNAIFMVGFPQLVSHLVSTVSSLQSTTLHFFGAIS